MRRFKTLVVVSNKRELENEYEYFSRLLEGMITKSRYTFSDALIETDSEIFHFVIEKESGRGYRCNHLIYLGKNETLRREVFDPTIRDFEHQKMLDEMREISK